jgi:hypothetical protein
MKSTPLTEAVASVARIFGNSNFPGRSMQGEGWNALVVLGMHRSGTSAMSGALAQLGVNFGDRLYRPQENVNEKGFFEHGPIVDLHDKLLQCIGSSWDDPRPLSQAIFSDERAFVPFRYRLTRMVRRDFAGAPIWGLKDPRISRLLPLWKAIFKELGVRSRYVIMVRSPLEVAASLSRRDGFSAEKSVFLWWQHMIESEAKTRDEYRVFVNYPDLLHDPSRCLRKVQTALQIAFPKNVESVKRDLDTFLVPSLRHHERANIAIDGALRSLVMDAFDIYQSAGVIGSNFPIEEFTNQEAGFHRHYASLSAILKDHLSVMSLRCGKNQMLLDRYYSCLAVKVAKRFCAFKRRA